MNYLVGMVSADVAECGGSRLTEQWRGVALQSIRADVLGVRDIGERWRKDGRRAGRGGRGGREVGQALGKTVHVDLNLWVVEVLLSVAVVRVTAAPAGENYITYI